MDEDALLPHRQPAPWEAMGRRRARVGAVHHAGVGSRREDVGAAALHRQAGRHRGHAGRRWTATWAASCGHPPGPVGRPTTRRTTPEAMAGKRWFGDAPGTSRRPPRNLGLLDSVGVAVSAAVQASLNRLAANSRSWGSTGWPRRCPEYARLVADGERTWSRLCSSSQTRRSR